MRRIGFILLVIATSMVMALPAVAKKPEKPSESTTYLATIEMLGDTGVATTSTCGGPIEVVRTDARRGAVTHFQAGGARLDVSAGVGGLDDGCHGALEVVPEYFRITFDGDQIAILWIFDVETHTEEVEHRNGKIRIETSRTDFRMGGPYVNGEFAALKIIDNLPDAVAGTITIEATGTFVFVQYDANGFADLDNGTQEFHLLITLTPA